MSKGQRLGYVYVGVGDRDAHRQLEGEELDRIFMDIATDRNNRRPQRNALFAHAHAGDTIVAQRMAGLARNADELRRIVLRETARGVHVQFVKERLVFTSEGSPMTDLLLTMLGAVADFERTLLKERHREGVALARQRGIYGGRRRKLSSERVQELRARAASGERKARLAREFGISRETLYQYLRESEATEAVCSTS
ncbi:MAG: recombinase family protein [Planctomycetia bacterium]|nr:MAG: recombinase family protein [Planctomycetia bacterium]